MNISWVRVVFWLTLASVALAILAGPLTRFGIIDFGLGIRLFGFASLAAGAGAVLSLIAVIVLARQKRPGAKWVIGSFLLGTVTAGFMLMLLDTAKSVPPIHDISTDTLNPPEFVDVLPLRADALNPPDYAGAEVAAQQKAAYPGIRTLVLTKAPGNVYDAAIDAAHTLGWEIVGSDPATGRIEATDTTAWFGFKDDVVIRIAATDSGTAVDVRSKSRVGMSDIGANAARIEKFLSLISY